MPTASVPASPPGRPARSWTTRARWRRRRAPPASPSARSGPHSHGACPPLRTTPPTACVPLPPRPCPAAHPHHRRAAALARAQRMLRHPPGGTASKGTFRARDQTRERSGPLRCVCGDPRLPCCCGSPDPVPAPPARGVSQDGWVERDGGGPRERGGARPALLLRGRRARDTRHGGPHAGQRRHGRQGVAVGQRVDADTAPGSLGGAWLQGSPSPAQHAAHVRPPACGRGFRGRGPLWRRRGPRAWTRRSRRWRGDSLPPASAPPPASTRTPQFPRSSAACATGTRGRRCARSLHARTLSPHIPRPPNFPRPFLRRLPANSTPWHRAIDAFPPRPGPTGGQRVGRRLRVATEGRGKKRLAQWRTVSSPSTPPFGASTGATTSAGEGPWQSRRLRRGLLLLLLLRATGC